jgi:hypothetical protein
MTKTILKDELSKRSSADLKWFETTIKDIITRSVYPSAPKFLEGVKISFKKTQNMGENVKVQSSINKKGEITSVDYLILVNIIFDRDFKESGKTIEFEFATRNITNYNSIAISSMNNNQGIKISTQTASLSSQLLTTSTKFKEDDRVRVSFVIEKIKESHTRQIDISNKAHLKIICFFLSSIHALADIDPKYNQIQLPFVSLFRFFLLLH